MFTGKEGGRGDEDACTLRNQVAVVWTRPVASRAAHSLQYKIYNAYRNTQYGMYYATPFTLPPSPHHALCSPSAVLL